MPPQRSSVKSVTPLETRRKERSMSDLHDAIRNFILENYLFTNDATALGLDDSLLDSGAVDSTGMMEIILFIEERLGVAMREDEMVPDNLDSVSKIATFVKGKLQSG
jgi:acyl carrier protein